MNPKKVSWMLLEGHSETGPFKFAQLQQRYANGEIQGDVLCFPKTVFGALSWRPLRYYFPEFDRTAANENHKDTGTTNGSRPTALFRCCNCNVKYESRYFLAQSVVPNAGRAISFARFRPLLLLSSSFRKLQHPRQQLIHRTGPRQVPRAVKSALTTLGLGESLDLELARKAYRKIVQSYHPDKVAHLGPELRRVAEAKTKELNTAISVVEEFLNSQ